MNADHPQVEFDSNIDATLQTTCELARALIGAHQAAMSLIVAGDWAHARKYISLSEKYAAWADYREPARGFGIHAYAHQVDRPIRLTDAELRAILSGETSGPRPTGTLRCAAGWRSR